MFPFWKPKLNRCILWFG